MIQKTIRRPNPRGVVIAALCALALMAAPLAPAAADCGISCADTSGSASGSDSGSGSGSAGSSGSAGASLGLVWPLLGLPLQAAALMIVPAPQFPSFDAVITHESSWNPYATNPQTGAYGLGQALPPEKMASFGADWHDNPVTQIRWAYDYMVERYGSPDGAWAFWQSHGWY